MIDIKTIVEEYQKGDYEKRLNLFLECPSLRNEFIQMEQDEASGSAHLSDPIDDLSLRRKSVGHHCKRLVTKFSSLI